MTDKYQPLREALSSVEHSDSAYWLDRYRGESGPETVRDLLAERDALRSALANLLDSLSLSDEDGLMEYAEPVIAARAALAGSDRDHNTVSAWNRRAPK